MYPLDEDELEELGDELGTDAMRIDARRMVAVPTDATRALAPLTDAEEIELTGMVAVKFCVVIGVVPNVPPTGATKIW